MSELNDLITRLCPDGVPYKKLGDLCKIETGRLNANKAVNNGAYPFFTTAEKTSRIDSYRWDTEALLIAGNANVGSVKHYTGKFEAYQRTYVLTNFNQDINVRFLFHFTRAFLKEYLSNKSNSAAMTYIVLSTLKNFEIPLPPLPVQAEIVRILDAFTELEAKLEAELEAELADRIEQYEYYRDHLLDKKNLERMDGGKVEHDTVDSLVDVITATAKIKKNEYKEIGIFPVIDQGMNTVIAGYTDNANALPDNEWILFGDHTCSLKYFDGRFVQGADGLKILKAHDNVLPKFVFYALKNLNVSSNEYARHWTSFKKNELPVPSLATQKRVVDILDRFDALTTSLTDGIPAEIAMRREQYEYYRSRLLDFPRLPDDVVSDGE